MKVLYDVILYGDRAPHPSRAGEIYSIEGCEQFKSAFCCATMHEAWGEEIGLRGSRHDCPIVGVCLKQGEDYGTDIRFCPWCGEAIVCLERSRQRFVKRAELVPQHETVRYDLEFVKRELQ